jgi:hypothetical protein
MWLELVRRAGGPTLQLSKRLLYVAVRLAAYDKRIVDHVWRSLDVGRKELLLPLRDDARLRAAARHVSSFSLTHGHTAAYVEELLAIHGQRKVARLTKPMLIGRMRKIQSTLGGRATLRRVRVLRGDLTPADCVEVADEIEKVRVVLSLLVREFRGR